MGPLAATGRAGRAASAAAGERLEDDQAGAAGVGAGRQAEGERLLGEVREAIRDEAFEAVGRHVTVAAAGLGGDVSLAGAQPLVMARLAAAPQSSANQPASNIARSDDPVAVPGGTRT